jgi:hypothetical protein
MTDPEGAVDQSRLFLEAHRHAWRHDAPPLSLDRDALLALLPTILASGSAGLVWPRLRLRVDQLGAAGFLLEQAYSLQAEKNRLVEQRVMQAAERLGRVGVMPVLIKGWSLSRRYPAGVIRVAGDIDLVVSAGEYEATLDTLLAWSTETGEINLELHHADRQLSKPVPAGGRSARRIDIDLHRDTQWDSRPAPDALQRAQRLQLENGLEIGVLCPEDNLRQLCFHYLWHGGARLMRLVDIALMLESRPDDFDWDRALGTDPRRRNWVVTALGLAHRLLGARIDNTPIAEEARRLPAWLPAVVERQAQQDQAPLGVAWAELKGNPREIRDVLRRRWPDPVTATIQMPAAFTAVPRLPIQWVVFLRRLGTYTVFRMPDQVTEGGRGA